jgi:hypothetical protein
MIMAFFQAGVCPPGQELFDKKSQTGDHTSLSTAVDGTFQWGPAKRKGAMATKA